MDAGGHGAVVASEMRLERRLIHFARLVAPAGPSAQVADPLAQQQLLFSPIAGRRQYRKRLSVKAQRVVVGVSRAGPISGRPQIAGTLELRCAEAEMVPEHRRVFKALGVRGAEPFEGGADQPVHFRGAAPEDFDRSPRAAETA